MAHAARRLNEEQRPAARRGAHLRVVDAPPARPKDSKNKGKGKTAAQKRQAAKGSAARGRSAAVRKPRAASLSAEGILAGATRAIMPEQRSDTALAASCRTAFRLFVVGLLVVSVLGLARVTLSAQAAATSVAAMKMKTELRAAVQQSESLELDRSSLARASRIESAAAGLQMARPATIRYIALPKALAVPAASAAAGASKTSQLTVPAPLKGVVDVAARITANEAQVLLASGSGLGLGR